MATTVTNPRKERTSEGLSRFQRTLIMRTLLTSVALVILLLYLMPLGYSVLTSLKTKGQNSDINAPVLPASAETFEYQGKNYDVYEVPLETGTKRLALLKKGRDSSTFVDPKNPDAGEITWEGRWRTLTPAYTLALEWSNYPKAFGFIKFLRLLGNTLMYASITTVAATFSAAIVAYGFARFNFPFKGVLFIVLISTIILPPQVTLVPTYAFFFPHRLGGYLAALNHTAVFFKRLQRVFAAPILPHDSDLHRRSGAHRRGGADSHFHLGDFAAGGSGFDRGRAVPLFLRLERLFRAADLPGGQRRFVADCGGAV